GVEADFYEMQADAKNVIHVLWMRQGSWFYGQLKNNEIINTEAIAGLGYVAVNKFRPRISVMPDGSEVHFCYTNKETAANVISHAYKDSSGWHRKTAYTADYSRLVQYPGMAVDGQGVAHFTFVRYSSGSNLIPTMYVRRAPGGEYIQMDYLSPKAVRNIWPEIYNDKNGNVHAMWSIDKKTLYYRFAEAGGDLSQSTTIKLPTINYYNKQPDAFLDSENNIHICFLAYEKPGTRINQGHTYANMDDLDFIETEHCNPELIKMEGHYHDDPVIAAKDPDNVYISWARESAANQVTRVDLAKKTDGVWKLTSLDNSALLKTDSKPAIAMSKNKVHIMWRSSTKTMKVYTETVGYGTGISAPVDGDNVCGPIVNFEANMDPETVSSIEFFVDGTSIGSSSEEPFSVDWDATEETLGQHALSIKASMTDGSTLEDAITITLNCPPELSIINLVDGGCVSGTVDIELYANDDRDELTKVELFIDNDLVSTFTSAPYSYTWNTDGLSEGNHSVKAIAYEASGQTTTDSVTVKTCPVYQPLNLTGEFSLKQTIFFRESSAVLNWEANPSNASVAEYRIYRIVKGIKELALTADPGTFTFKEVVDDSVEVLAYAVTTVDNSGNESTGAFVILEKVQ
ncbi:MAG: hypothetical protein KAS21_04790, partial [Candidatus Aminicenantes bacterium]|nr:hypothetical protein [Candidatus Aminicenantes bacterium]